MVTEIREGYVVITIGDTVIEVPTTNSANVHQLEV